VLLARAYLALGDAEGARLELQCAREVFAQLGSHPDVSTVQILEDELEVRSRRATTKPHALTKRELQVLRLIATGKTNKRIARDLALSEKTIDRHVSNIFVKVNVASRAAATAFAYEHELI
jgi:DNA-binding NarL/FixJ family response regulator